MGLTHNWHRPTELPADAFARAVTDCRRVLSGLDVPLAGFEGIGDPIFDANTILFNGVTGSCCEPFEIHQTEFDRRGRRVVFSFCKTEHAPYDICVKVAIVVLKHHFGNAILVGSDATDADWEDARQACQKSLNYGADFRLDKE